MKCGRCGSGRVEWKGPLSALTHTECADCGAINAQEPEEVLPDGLTRVDGVVLFDCRSCGEPTELPIDPSEFDPDDPHNVCGRSPRCCP